MTDSASDTATAEPSSMAENRDEEDGRDPLSDVPRYRTEELTARIEPFDSFWEAPSDFEKGYDTFGRFYAHNYLDRIPNDRSARILVISCGPGYFVNLLDDEGYRNVVGIDSSPGKVEHGQERGLNCHVARAFEFLAENEDPFDLIFAEQEINHLTKTEILAFFRACRENLASDGRLIVHSINGSNPLVGAESRAGNFDHYNSFTEYSLPQTLEHAGFRRAEPFPLNLYVFWANPANYVALAISKALDVFFLCYYILVGKSARIYTKKIAAVAEK